ncbi:hypothetical protein PAXRUDRAFT_180546, partial [Paxillus rubicundulus Ve08.2h10]
MQLLERVDRVLKVLNQMGLSVSSFTSSLISLDQYKNYDAVAHLLSHGLDLINMLRSFLNENHCDHHKSELDRASEMMMVTYAHKVCEASAEANSSHFRASCTLLNQLEEFSVDVMAQQMEDCAPRLWKLFNVLLDARNSQNDSELDSDHNMDTEDSTDEDAYWEELGESELEGGTIAGGNHSDTVTQQCQAFWHALIKIKKVVILSILMHSTNRKSNGLQSLSGIFLQSTHTPQKVIETLAQM